MTGQSFMLKAMLFAVALMGLGLVKMPQATAAEHKMVYCRAEPPSDYFSSVTINNKKLRPLHIKTPRAFIAFKFPVKRVPGTPLKTACLTPRLSEEFIKQRLKPGASRSTWYLKVVERLKIDGEDRELRLGVSLSYDFDGNGVERNRKLKQKSCLPVSDQPDKFGLLRFGAAKKGRWERLNSLVCTNPRTSFTSYPAKGGESISKINCDLSKNKQPDKCVMFFLHRGWSWYLEFPGALLFAWPEIYKKIIAELDHALVISISPDGCKGELCKNVMGALKE